MRIVVVTFCLAGLVWAQSATNSGSNSAAKPAASAPAAAETLMIPAGTKVPVALKHAISTKGTRTGDAVYAETTFPVVANNRVLIPAGTYVQGRISEIQRGGHIKGRAQVLMHFTSLIYPTGYTVILPGAVENAPGVDKTGVKDEEGTLQKDSQTGSKVGTVATTAGTGAVVGGLSQGGKGALIGAGVGGVVGTAIAMLSRGDDLKMDAGTTIELVVQRDIPLDASRVPNVTSVPGPAQ
jgi:hypothetical protein